MEEWRNELLVHSELDHPNIVKLLVSHCLPSTFHCLSSTFHCLSLTFHCLSSIFHCLSVTYHCLPLVDRAPGRSHQTLPTGVAPARRIADATENCSAGAAGRLAPSAGASDRNGAGGRAGSAPSPPPDCRSV